MADTRLPSLSAFQEHVSRSAPRPDARPVVVRLAPDELGACHGPAWAPEGLQARPDVKDVLVGVHRGRVPAFFDFRSSPMELARSAVVHTTRLGDLVGRIVRPTEQLQQQQEFDLLSGTDTHLFVRESGGVIQRWAGVWKDCEHVITRDLGKEGHLERVGFWVSGRGLSSQMHWDVNGHHNLNYQVYGRKSVVMFAPEDTPFLYCMPARLWHLSRIDPRPGHFSLASHPLFARARPVRFELSAGDVLFIPAGWYHHFTHEGDYNVNVTAWFTSPRSGRKWSWASVLVPRPWEAWFFVAKFLFALVVCLPWVLVSRRMGG